MCIRDRASARRAAARSRSRSGQRRRLASDHAAPVASDVETLGPRPGRFALLGAADPGAPEYSANRGGASLVDAPADRGTAQGSEVMKDRIRQVPRIRRSSQPMMRAVLHHLRGRHVMGVYPLLEDETCWFLAVDFDKSTWTED